MYAARRKWLGLFAVIGPVLRSRLNDVVDDEICGAMSTFDAAHRR